MGLEAVTESREGLTPDEVLGVVDDGLVEELVHGGGRGEGLRLDEPLEETAGVQPALVELPAEVPPLLLGLQAGPDVPTVEPGERLSRHLPGLAVDWETARADLQALVVEPPLGHQVVSQVLLLSHRLRADLADIEM